MNRFLPILSLLLCAAAPESRRVQSEHVTWEVFSLWNEIGPLESESDGRVNVSLPTENGDGGLVSFLTSCQLGGDMTGKTITATFAVESVGVPTFVYGYEGQSWDTCPAPASVRLYFTTEPGSYDLDEANAEPTNYWWADFACVPLESLRGTGSTTLTASLADPSAWSDASGVSGADESQAFFNAASNVAQVGFAFGGGCFYDTGVGVAKTDRSTFSLIEFQIQ